MNESLPTPNDRVESLLMAILTGDGTDLPVAKTRTEKLLLAIYESGGASEEQIANALNNYISTHPEILGGITEAQCQQIVETYVTAHHDELKGDPGYTPIKGTDYWTSEDISEIQSYIDTQIGGALNGTY